jgi:hypothetical protein
MSKLKELERTRKQLQRKLRKSITKAVENTPKKVIENPSEKAVVKSEQHRLYQIESTILNAVKPAKTATA